MIIKVVIENTAIESYKCQHGLSLYIEHKGRDYLLDSGCDGRFIENADKLNIDLGALDYVIASHGHFDHCGGFRTLLSDHDLMIYAMKDLFDEYYSNSNDQMHYIGVSKRLMEYRDHFIFIDEITELEKDVYLVPDLLDEGIISKKTGMFKKVGSNYVYDTFSHELSLVFKSNHGLMIFNSCSHRGVKEIIEHVEEEFNEPVNVYVGGLHLKGGRYSDAEIEDIGYMLKEKGIELYTGHCTDLYSYRILKSILKEKIHHLSSGKIIIM